MDGHIGRLAGPDAARYTGAEAGLNVPITDSVLAQIDKRLANVRCTLQEVRERMRVKDAQLFGEVPANPEVKPDPCQTPSALGELILRAKQLDDLAADVLLAVAKYEAI